MGRVTSDKTKDAHGLYYVPLLLSLNISKSISALRHQFLHPIIYY
jgi:hypothetical protein